MQGADQQGGEALAQRVGGDQLLELGDGARAGVGVVDRRLDEVLGRGEAQLRPAGPERVGLVAAEVGQGRAAPQIQRCAQEAGGRPAVVGPQCAAPVRGQALEPDGVDGCRIDLQRVPPESGF
nr:hypothetical protein [Dactylosporangium vinaceum]